MLSNFGHMTTSKIFLESSAQNFIGDVIDRKFDGKTFVLKCLYFKKTWSGQLCWHHQNYNNVD